jgi:hypothetical protein
MAGQVGVLTGADTAEMCGASRSGGPMGDQREPRLADRRTGRVTLSSRYPVTVPSGRPATRPVMPHAFHRGLAQRPEATALARAHRVIRPGPLWAGLIALADQEAGHPLGFVNPAIYRIARSALYQKAFPRHHHRHQHGDLRRGHDHPAPLVRASAVGLRPGYPETGCAALLAVSVPGPRGRDRARAGATAGRRAAGAARWR